MHQRDLTLITYFYPAEIQANCIYRLFGLGLYTIFYYRLRDNMGFIWAI